MAKISVILINTTEKAALDKVVYSVLNQNFDDFELIVVDRENFQFNNAFLDDKRIRIIKIPEEFNMPKLLNESARQANSELVCFLDSSDLLLFDSLKVRYQTFCSNPECVCVYGFGLETDQDFNPCDSEQNNYFYKALPLPENTLQSFINLSIYPQISSFMLKKEVFDRIEFNEKYQENYIWEFFINLFNLNENSVIQIQDPLYLSQNSKFDLTSRNEKQLIFFLSEIIKTIDQVFINRKIRDEDFSVFYEGYKNAFWAATFIQMNYFPGNNRLKLYILANYLNKPYQLSWKIFETSIFLSILGSFLNTENFQLTNT